MRKTQKVSDLSLSVRTLNCLRAEEIRTIGELVSHTEAELYERANIGKKTLREITAALTVHGLTLRSD